jgi:S1-C subfamily serine protease
MVSGAPAWMQGLAAIGTLVISVLVALRLIPDTPLNPTPTPGASASAVAATDWEDLVDSVVQVQIMAGGVSQGWGSGTVIDESGLILTNAHVATPSDIEEDELVIAVSDRSDAAPEARYRAEVAATDIGLDLAIIRITETLGGGPYTGGLEAVPIGDSEDVGIGDDLFILGYPAIGGETISYADGSVSGFTADPIAGSHAWIKTDATIAGGNSGGLAANAAGAIIGVPTQLGSGGEGPVADCRVLVDTNGDGAINDQDDCIPTGGFYNSVRPINLVQDMLDAVLAGTTYEPTIPDVEVSTGFDVANVRFDRPVFVSEQPPADDPDYAPSEDLIWLASGATQVCAWWPYEGMADGVTYDAIWARDGEVIEEVSYLDQLWTGGETGAWWVCVLNEEGIADGMWDLTLNVEDELITGSFAAVGDDLEPVSVTVANDGPETICYLLISPSTSSFWGGDWLGSDQTIGPDQSIDVGLPPATYDLRGLDCNVEEIFVDQQEIAAPTTLTY